MSLAYMFYAVVLFLYSQSVVDCRWSPNGWSVLRRDLKGDFQELKSDIGQLRSEERRRYNVLTERIQALQKSVDQSGSGPSINKTRIHVRITVTDDSIIKPSLFNQTWNATAIKGDSMFVVLKKLQVEQRTFNFTYLMYSYGDYITGFVGIEAKSDLKQYWAFLKYPDIYMQTGVSDTYPADGEHYIFNATTY